MGAPEQEPAGPEEDPDTATPHDRPMSLVDHLSELRTRIFWAILAWAAASVACYFYTPKFLELVRPLLGKDAILIFTAPTEAFFAYLTLAMVAGIFVASPVILYQILMFVLPGLTVRERRWLLLMMPMAMLLFVAGLAFAYYAVLPVTMGFFMSYATPDLKPQIKIGDFLGFVQGILLLLGVVFQLPLVLLFLANLGIVNSRSLSRHRRIALFGSFLVSAVVTPTPDAMTCIVVALPLWLLFEVSLVLMRLTGK
ncbi:MAG: twin-arginine translocase subunit TatC [Candidatus Eremiobacterota bacterium]